MARLLASEKLAASVNRAEPFMIQPSGAQDVKTKEENGEFRIIGSSV
jgi:hypothetical protein